MKPPYPELSRNPEARIAQIEADIQDRPEIAGFQGYEKLVNDNKARRPEFIGSHEGNPRLSYKLLMDEQLQQLIDLGQTAEASLVTFRKRAYPTGGRFVRRYGIPSSRDFYDLYVSAHVR